MLSYEIRKKKIELRKKFLQERDSLSIAEIKEKSLKIKEILFNLKEFKSANTIMFFVSFRSEVMTNSMIKEALELGKAIVVPKAEKHTQTLQVYYINDFHSDLSFGTYGILEPKADRCKRADKKAIDIVIVPGAAFTERGDRIGYGAGYYDRFCENLPEKTSKIALAFELQLADEIPTSENDVRVDMIITEKRAIRCGEPPVADSKK